MFWDSTILGLLLIIITLLTSIIPVESNFIKGALILLSILSFEPLFIYFRGSTIGHQSAGIKIINVDEKKKLSLFQCYLRTLVKNAAWFNLIANVCILKKLSSNTRLYFKNNGRIHRRREYANKPKIISSTECIY